MRLGCLAVVGALVLGGCSSPSGPSRSSGSSSAGGSSSGASGASDEWVAVDDDDALFTVDCTFSHRASDDPIVHPGHPGASHSHEFFGSAATDAHSTGASLQGTATTCEDAEDTAAYWVPTLSVDGEAVDPTFARAYYRAAPGTDVREVQAPPLGLAMIAGDPAAGSGSGSGSGSAGSSGSGSASSEGDGQHHDHGSGSDGGGAVGEAGWGCGLRPRRLHAEPPTDCTDPSPLTLQLRFPDCWDGERLDADDHRSHVAASVDGACPDTHPVLVTQLQLSIQWPVTGAAGDRVALSSGPVAGAHGDFLNGWDEAALEAHVDLCIRAKANCTIG